MKTAASRVGSRISGSGGNAFGMEDDFQGVIENADSDWGIFDLWCDDGDGEEGILGKRFSMLSCCKVARSSVHFWRNSSSNRCWVKSVRSCSKSASNAFCSLEIFSDLEVLGALVEKGFPGEESNSFLFA